MRFAHTKTSVTTPLGRQNQPIDAAQIRSCEIALLSITLDNGFINRSIFVRNLGQTKFRCNVSRSARMFTRCQRIMQHANDCITNA